MGREIVIEKAQAVYDEKNNDVITKMMLIDDESNNRFICGRTDFTNALSNYFYGDEVYYIFVTDNDSLVGKKIAISTKNNSDKTEDEDVLYCYGVSKKGIFETIDEYANREKEDWRKANEAYEDLRAARRNTTKLTDFEEFSNAMDGVSDWMSNCNLEANNFGRMLEEALKELTDREFAVIVLSE